MTKIPEGWAESTIPQVAEVLDTKRIPINSDERAARIDGKSQQSLVAYYGATGQVGWIDTHLFDEDLVLLGEDGVSFLDPGKPKAYRVSGKSWVNNHAHVLRARQDALDWRLLEAQLNTLNYTGHVTGSTRLKLTQGAMNKLPILVPPLAEQKRIADKLDTVLTRVDAVNTRLVRVAPLLKRFRQSVLAAATSGRLTEDWRAGQPDISEWKTEKLNDLGELGRGKSKHRPRNDPRLYGGVHPFVQTGDVANANQWITSHKQTYSDFGLDQSKLWPANTLCITIAANIADTALLSYPACFPDSVVGFVANEACCLPRFIKWSIDVRKDDLERLAPATAQKNINLGVLEEVEIHLPSLEEQTEIVRRVETLFAFADRLEARLAQAQTAATRLTPALLAKAFRGELVPQDPNDEPAAELLRRLQAERASAPKASAGRGRKAVVQS